MSRKAGPYLTGFFIAEPEKNMGIGRINYRKPAQIQMGKSKAKKAKKFTKPDKPLTTFFLKA